MALAIWSFKEPFDNLQAHFAMKKKQIERAMWPLSSYMILSDLLECTISLAIGPSETEGNPAKKHQNTRKWAKVEETKTRSISAAPAGAPL